MTVVLKEGCFVCKKDLPFNRLKVFLPCRNCEGKEEEIIEAKRPTKTYGKLVKKYISLFGSHPLKIYRVWLEALLKGEDISIPWLDIFKPGDFVRWVLLSYSGSKVVVGPEEALKILFDSPVIKNISPVFDEPKGPNEVLILSPEEAFKKLKNRKLQGLLVWFGKCIGLSKLKSEFGKGFLFLEVCDNFPYQILPGFWSKVDCLFKAPEIKKVSISDLFSLGDLVIELAYEYLPYFDQVVYNLFEAVISKKKEPAGIALLAKTLEEQFRSRKISDFLKKRGLLENDEVFFLNCQNVIKEFYENSHPERREHFCLTEIDEKFKELFYRCLNFHGFNLRFVNTEFTLKDSASLILLVSRHPSLSELGVEKFSKRYAEGFEVYEFVGLNSFVTLLKIDKFPEIKGKTVNFGPSLLPRLFALARRYQNVSILARPYDKWVASILFAYLRPLPTGVRLFLFDNFYSFEFQRLEESEILKELEVTEEKIEKEHEFQVFLKKRIEPPRPSFIVSQILKEMADKEVATEKVYRVFVDGLSIDVSQKDVESAENLKRAEIEIERVEEFVEPPSPLTLFDLLEKSKVSPLKTLKALESLYEHGYITDPLSKSHFPEIVQKIFREYIESRWGKGFLNAHQDKMEGIFPLKLVEPEDFEVFTKLKNMKRENLAFYRLIFRATVSSLMKPVKVSLIRLVLYLQDRQFERKIPVKIVEPGFNLVSPIKLLPFSVSEDLRIVRIQEIEKRVQGLSGKELFKRLFDLKPLGNIFSVLGTLENWIDFSKPFAVLKREKYTEIKEILRFYG